jgi:hypothetical protein
MLWLHFLAAALTWIGAFLAYRFLTPARSRPATALLYSLIVAVPLVATFFLLPTGPPFAEAVAVIALATLIAAWAGWQVEPKSPR